MTAIQEYLMEPAILLIKRRKANQIICATDHFLLTTVTETERDRTAIAFNFGEASFYVGAGEAPKLYVYTGVISDIVSAKDQIPKWLLMYNRFLRGSKCVRNDLIAELFFRDQYRLGLLVGTQLDYDAAAPYRAIFSMTMFVLEEL